VRACRRGSGERHPGGTTGKWQAGGAYGAVWRSCSKHSSGRNLQVGGRQALAQQYAAAARGTGSRRRETLRCSESLQVTGIPASGRRWRGSGSIWRGMHGRYRCYGVEWRQSQA